MISTVDEFERRLTALDPKKEDFVLGTDDLVANLSPDIAALVFKPIFRFFERHPEAHCGAPGTLVHHVEHFYPNYIPMLRESVLRTPSYNGVLMINRIMNSKISGEERKDYLGILSSVAGNGTISVQIRDMAQRFLNRQLAARAG